MPTPLAELDGLGLERAGERVLGPLSVALEPGLTGIIGPSGGGKTTLLRLLSGRLPGQFAHYGRLWARGLRVRAGEPLRGAVLATQDAQSGLDPRARVGRLVHWAAGAGGRARAEAMLRALALDPDDVWRQRTATLSGGMRQRVLLAMAILRADTLLLVDEPTSALDDRNAGRVLTAIHQWQRRAPEHRAALVVSHDLPRLCAWADRLWVIARGRLEEQCTGRLRPGDLRSCAGRAHAAALAHLEGGP